MAVTEDRLPFLAWLSPRAAALLSGGLAVPLLVAGVFTPANVVLPVLYGVPLVVGAGVRKPGFTWGMALFLVALSFASFFLWGQASVDAETAALVNLGLSALATLLIAGLLHVW